MKQKPKILRNYYDTLSSVYDTVTRKKHFFWYVPGVLNKLLGARIRKGNSILDIGVGTGQSSLYFYKKGCRVTGIDISQKMVDIAQAKMPKGQFYCVDVERIQKIPGAPFDVVLSSGVFEFIERLSQIFRLSAKSLKLGGYFCFTYEEYLPKTKHQKWKASELGRGVKKTVPAQLSLVVYRRSYPEIKEMLSQAGFEVIQQKKFTAYYKGGEPVIYSAILARKEK